MKAAVGFKPYADKTAKKVFKRCLIERFPEPTTPPPDFLDPHQKEGVNWILTRSRSYLAHAPGAGKTAQAIVASQMVGAFCPTLFIVPPSLCLNWAREILKWTKDIWPSIYVVGKTADKDNCDWSADFLIVPDSMLTKPWVYDRLSKMKFGLLAVDEASRFKEVTSERTKALFGGKGERTYYGLVANARHSVLLDGSPMPNRPMELWAPTFAMAPEVIDFMGHHEFGVKYCAARFIADEYKLDWDYRGASNLEELKRRLQKKFMHVVGEERLNHPERKRSMLFMSDVRDAQMKTWERRHLGGFLFDDIDEDMSQGDIAAYRQELGLRKVDFVVNYVRSRLESKNESILVFAWHRAVCGAIANGLRTFRSGLVTGDTGSEDRENIFRSFQAGTCRVIVGNIGAMGRGHNLQRAKRVVFAEYSWTDELNKQCEKRASRKGATADIVRCDYVVAAGTMDEIVLNSIFKKAANVRKAIG
jgi:superfamily II DNA or RNA helicase